MLDIKRYGRGVMSENGSLNMDQLKLIKIPILINNNYSNIIDDIICFEKTINNYLINIDLINDKLNNQLIKYLSSIKNNNNIDKIIQVDEEVKDVKKSKTKTKSINI